MNRNSTKKKMLERRAVSLLVAFAMLNSAVPCFDMLEWLDLSTNFVAHAERAEGQTKTFSSLDDFIDYTYDIHEAADGYQTHQCDTITLTISSGEIYEVCDTGNNSKTFYPLGSADYPFAGSLRFSTGGSAVIQFNLQGALFDYIYDTATITDTADTPLQLSLSRVEGGSGTLFANHVVDDPEDADDIKASANVWKLKTVCYENMAYGEANYMEYNNVDFAGLIDTIDTSALVNLEVENNNALIHSTGYTSVTASNNAGLLCNTLSGTLNVNSLSGTNTSYSVTASNGSAGGLVGAMGAGSVLNLNYEGTFGLNDADNTDNVSPTITGTTNAGGLVGLVNGGKIIISSDVDASEYDPASSYSAGDYCTYESLVYKATGATTGTFDSENWSVLAKYTIDSYSIEAESGENSVSGESEEEVIPSTFAGGLVGNYINSNSNDTVTAENFDFKDSWNITNCDILADVTGGLIGHYTNNITTATIKNATTSTFSTSCSTGAAGATYYHGGVIGEYDCDDLARALVFDSVGTSFTCPLSTVKGGAVAFVNSASYIKASDLSVDMTVSSNTYTGGVIGLSSAECDSLFDFGNVTVNTNSTTICAGLVANLNSSVLRLSGTTDLAAAPATAGANNGQLVGSRSRGLVYALGTGADTSPSYSSGWQFVRSAAVNVDDIGSWGEVLRPDGTRITVSSLESSNGANTGILDFNSTAHTVRVAAPAYSSSKYTINNESAFVKVALNYQLNTDTEERYNGAITFETANISSSIAERDIDITANIDLSDLGITGFTRDNSQGTGYTGTLTGNGNTITLAIGEAYGIRGGSELTTDGVQGSGKIYRHVRLGLFNNINGATVSSITLTGGINATFTTGAAYVGGLASYASGNFRVTSLTATEVLNIKHSAGDNAVRVGGIIGNVGNDSVSGSDAFIASSTSRITAVFDNDSAGRTLSYGGFIGLIDDPDATYTFTNDTIGGSVSATNSFTDMRAGGLIGETASKATDTADLRNLIINGVTVQNYTQANNASKTAGGVLGYSWPNTNVTFTDLDVSSTTALSMTGNSKPYSHEFAGLVFLATGYWKVDDVDLNALTVTDSNYTTSFGLMVNKGTNVNTVKSALYLELTSTSAYYINSSNVSITLGSSRASDLIFDELVAFSADYSSTKITEKQNGETVTIGYMPNDTNVMNNKQGVVSIRTSSNAVNMSSGNCNTYQNATKNGGSNGSEWPFNKYTRYYHHFPSFENKK